MDNYRMHYLVFSIMFSIISLIRVLHKSKEIPSFKVNVCMFVYVCIFSAPQWICFAFLLHTILSATHSILELCSDLCLLFSQKFSKFSDISFHTRGGVDQRARARERSRDSVLMGLDQRLIRFVQTSSQCFSQSGEI